MGKLEELKREESLIIRKIRNGIVIDHIPAGRALTVLKVLGLTGKEGYRIALVMNVESKKLGRKDIVKIEDKELSRDELNIISLIAPTATINVIREYEVKHKFKVEVPQVIENVFKCRNPRCITNQPREPIKPRFVLVSKDPLILKCDYCGTYHTIEDIEKQLLSK